MDFLTNHATREQEISDLFFETFSASEGAAEGAVIRALVDAMMADNFGDALIPFLAVEEQVLVGCIFFSRLRFENDARRVFLLSPVAVKTDRQKQGVGQKLISFGLETLRQNGVDMAFTYGDPSYYSKLGFEQVSEDVAPAPLPLSMPEGWLAQSLCGQDQAPLAGPSHCIAPFNIPELW